jgi:hypothetical protein
MIQSPLSFCSRLNYSLLQLLQVASQAYPVH